MGGDFIIDKNGRLTFCYLSSIPSDRPDVDSLISSLKAGVLSPNICTRNSRCICDIACLQDTRYSTSVILLYLAAGRGAVR